MTSMPVDRPLAPDDAHTRLIQIAFTCSKGQSNQQALLSLLLGAKNDQAEVIPACW